jgi:hypothetical protein
MKSVIMYIVSIAVVLIAFLLIVDYSSTIPDVLFSHSTGQCVGVQNYMAILIENPIYSCENLPTKYNHIWVK